MTDIAIDLLTMYSSSQLAIVVPVFQSEKGLSYIVLPVSEEMMENCAPKIYEIIKKYITIYQSDGSLDV